MGADLIEDPTFCDRADSFIATDPEAGAIIRGSGGCRKAVARAGDVTPKTSVERTLTSNTRPIGPR